jgi:ketosteroid isomerase-like protein
MSAAIAHDEPGAHAGIELAKRLLAALEAGDARAIDELLHATYRDHTEGARAAELADLRIVPEDFIAEGDRVVARVRVSGVRRGTRVEGEQVHIWRVVNGRLAEHWMAGDDLAAATRRSRA